MIPVWRIERWVKRGVSPFLSGKANKVLGALEANRCVRERPKAEEWGGLDLLWNGGLSPNDEVVILAKSRLSLWQRFLLISNSIEAQFDAHERRAGWIFWTWNRRAHPNRICRIWGFSRSRWWIVRRYVWKGEGVSNILSMVLWIWGTIVRSITTIWGMTFVSLTPIRPWP